MINDLKGLVKNCRKQRSLSQAGLAKLAGVGKTVVFDLEHGKETVQLDTVTRILRALDIHASFQGPHGVVSNPALPVSVAETPPETEDEGLVPVHLL